MRHRVALEMGAVLLKKKREDFETAQLKKIKKISTKTEGGKDERPGSRFKAVLLSATVRSNESEAAMPAAAVSAVERTAAELKELKERMARPRSDSSEIRDAFSGRVLSDAEMEAEARKSKLERSAAARLWQKITARTDELYMVIEKMLSTFESSMRRLAAEAGEDSTQSAQLSKAVQVGELKSQTTTSDGL
jgi:hypothetical protein